MKSLRWPLAASMAVGIVLHASLALGAITVGETDHRPGRYGISFGTHGERIIIKKHGTDVATKWIRCGPRRKIHLFSGPDGKPLALRSPDRESNTTRVYVAGDNADAITEHVRKLDAQGNKGRVARGPALVEAFESFAAVVVNMPSGGGADYTARLPDGESVEASLDRTVAILNGVSPHRAHWAGPQQIRFVSTTVRGEERLTIKNEPGVLPIQVTGKQSRLSLFWRDHKGRAFIHQTAKPSGGMRISVAGHNAELVNERLELLLEAGEPQYEALLAAFGEIAAITVSPSTGRGRHRVTDRDASGFVEPKTGVPHQDALDWLNDEAQRQWQK